MLGLRWFVAIFQPKKVFGFYKTRAKQTFLSRIISRQSNVPVPRVFIFLMIIITKSFRGLQTQLNHNYFLFPST